MSTAESTFKCERCGRDVPERLQKEVFTSQAGGRSRSVLCPTCLDDVMQGAHEVYGVPGDEKRRAAFVTDESEGPPQEATGRREE